MIRTMPVTITPTSHCTTDYLHISHKQDYLSWPLLLLFRLPPPIGRVAYPERTSRPCHRRDVSVSFPPRFVHDLLPTRQLSSYSIICGTLSAEIQKATPRLLLNCNRCTATVPPLSGLRNRIEPSSFITAIINLNHTCHCRPPRTE